MNNRRNFIKNLGALGLLLGTTKLDLSAQTKSTKSATSTKINKPLFFLHGVLGLKPTLKLGKF